MMNIAVAQSGGPTCVINASLLGVFRAAKESGRVDRVYGSVHGIEGVLNGHFADLTDRLSDPDEQTVLRQTPGAALGSCRYKLPNPEQAPEVYQQIADRLEQLGVGAFFYIGGNDSMDTAAKLSAYFRAHNSTVRVIGVPKTIDNDLMHTDHTPGFGSAARYLAVTLQEIVRDSSVYDLDSVTIVEIMGRHAGWLTASSCLLRGNGDAAPHLIYLPEAQVRTDRIIADIREKLKMNRTVIVAVSEGITFADGDQSGQYMSGATDGFGHKYLSGIGKFLENAVKTQIGCKVRSVELNVMQRCSAHLASGTDLDEAEAVGAAAVQAALRGETGKMMVFRRVSDAPYRVEIDSVDASLAANGERCFPKEWINADQNDVTDDAIAYFRPLIQGEPMLRTKNGLPLQWKL